MEESKKGELNKESGVLDSSGVLGARWGGRRMFLVAVFLWATVYS